MTEELEIIVDKYLRGTPLSAKEDTILQEAKKNVTFKLEFENMIVIQTVAGIHDRERIKNLLKKKEISYIQKSYLKRAGLISLVIITALLLFYLLKPSADTPAVLFAAHYQPYPNVVDPLTKGENDLSAYQLYEQKQYQKAIDKFNENDILSIEDNLYLGFSYLAIDDIENASKSWQNINDPKYMDVIQWYNALICLKEGLSDCKPIFQSIANGESVYKDEAKKIMGGI